MPIATAATPVDLLRLPIETALDWIAKARSPIATVSFASTKAAVMALPLSNLVLPKAVGELA